MNGTLPLCHNVPSRTRGAWEFDLPITAFAASQAGGALKSIDSVGAVPSDFSHCTDCVLR